MDDAHLLIWAPGTVAELRQPLRKAEFCEAVLVEVKSGTVIIPSDRMTISTGTVWAYKAKRLLRRAAVVMAWNDAATAVYPVSGGVALGWEWGPGTAVQDLIARLGGYGEIRRAALAIAGDLATSKSGEAKQKRAAGRIAAAFGASEATIFEHVRRYETRLPPGHLMNEIGRRDVAEVVRLMEFGAFDRWRADRSTVLPVVQVVGGDPVTSDSQSAK